MAVERGNPTSSKATRPKIKPKPKPKTYKDWSAAVSNDKKIKDLVTGAKKSKPIVRHLDDKTAHYQNPNTPQKTAPPLIPYKQPYGTGTGMPNSNSPRTADRGRPVTKKPLIPARKGVANSPTMAPPKTAGKPTPKPGAAPYQAPVVASGGRSPSPATVNGKPVSKSNPIPAKAAPGKTKTPAQLATEKKMRDQAYWDPFNKQAQDSITAQNLPMLNEIQRQMDEITARGQRNIGDISERGKREQANLGEIYRGLSAFQEQIKGAQAKNYEALQTKGAASYDQLQGALTKNFDESQAASLAESQRLGIPLTANPNEGSERDQAFLSGLANVDKTNFGNNMAAGSAGFDGLMSQMQMNAGSEGAMRQAMSMRDTNKTIEDLQFELEQTLTGLGGRRLDIKSVEGQKVNELMRVLEESQYARNAEQAQRQFQNDLATKQFGLQERAQNAAMMPQPVAPPSYYEQLQATKLEQEIMAAQAANSAQISQIRAPERNIPTTIPPHLRPYASPNAIDNYGRYAR